MPSSEIAIGGPLASSEAEHRLVDLLVQAYLPIQLGERSDSCPDEPSTDDEQEFYQDAVADAVSNGHALVLTTWEDEDGPERFRELLPVLEDLGLTYRIFDNGQRPDEESGMPSMTLSSPSGRAAHEICTLCDFAGEPLMRLKADMTLVDLVAILVLADLVCGAGAVPPLTRAAPTPH